MNPRTRRTRRLRQRTRKRLEQLRSKLRQIRAAEAIEIGLRVLLDRQSKAEPRPAASLEQVDALVQRLIMKSDGTPDESLREVARHTARKMTTTHPGLPNQDVASRELVRSLVRRVEAACKRMRMEPLPGATFGTLNEPSINAFSAPFFGSASLIVVHSELFTFVLLLAKCIVPAVCALKSAGLIALGDRPEDAQFDDAARRLAELARAIKLHSKASAAPHYQPTADWPHLPLVRQFIADIELFVVAHEYGHLMSGHGLRLFEVDEEDAVQEELHADAFALMVAIADRASKIPMLTVLAPLAMLKVLALMERDGVMPKPTEHPPSEVRLAVLQDLLSDQAAANAAVGQLLGVFSNVEALVDEVWGAARARTIAMELTDLLARCMGDRVPDYSTFQEEATALLQFFDSEDDERQVLELARAIVAEMLEYRGGGKVLTKEVFHRFKLIYGSLDHVNMGSALRAKLEAIVSQVLPSQKR